MLGSLHKSRLIVSIASRSNITLRNVVYRASNGDVLVSLVGASTDAVSDAGDRDSTSKTVTQRRRRGATDRDRRASLPLGNDTKEGSSRSLDATLTSEIPYAVKQMRERMREKYGLNKCEKDRENIVNDQFRDNNIDNVNVKHTAINNKNDTHYGFVNDTVDTNAARPVKQPDYKDLFQKFRFLKSHKVTDKIMDMTFGAMRLDSMNQPLAHGDRDRFNIHKNDLESEGDIEMDHLPKHSKQNHTLPKYVENGICQQSDPYIETMKSSTTHHSTQLPSAHTESDTSHKTQANYDSYIEEHYFGIKDLSSNTAEIKQMPEFAGDSFIEKQYFDSNHLSSDKQDQGMTEASTTENVFDQYLSATESVSTRFREMPANNIQPSKPQITDYSTEQQSKTSIMSSNMHNVNSTMDPSQHCPEDNLFDSQYFSEGVLTSSEPHPSRNVNDGTVKHTKTVHLSTTESSADATLTATDYFGTMTKQEKKQRNQPVPDLQKPHTAFDLAMKIRLEAKGKLPMDENKAKVTTPSKTKWMGKVDSKGFRILEDQVLNLDYLTEDIVLKILKDSIIYEDDDVIAINKPYGLPSHGGPRVHHSMDRYTHALADTLGHSNKVNKLHLVHRLDKETTGVFLLAKSEKVAWRLHQMFKKREVVKKYWVITKGVPNPTEGVIDIPMAEAEVQGKYRMALRPNYSPETKVLMKSSHKVDKFEAVTNYRVLESHLSTALVECQPESGVKHQIRCHLAFGLNTPILGDHKYSHYAKIAPQKLYPDILQRLGIRQSKVRHVPMHLHAISIILPEFNNGRNIFISARLPKHFVQNMKWLKLKVPK